jgi:predicted peptidase
MAANRLIAVAAFLTVVFSATAIAAQDLVDGFAARTFVGKNGTKMQYRLFVPDQKARTRPLPAIVYLHGSGGIGSDNLKQISGGNTNGTHVWTTARMQARYPAFVVAPQLPAGERWDRQGGDGLAPYAQLVIELLDSLSREFTIDHARIYLTGQSMGGIGTWDLITKRPDAFAAAVPLCGAGTPARAAAAKGVAIWAFHGAKDDTVPVSGSRDMVAALRASGSNVKYTEYPDVGHDVWSRAYADPQLPGWLFAQQRSPKPKQQ